MVAAQEVLHHAYDSDTSVRSTPDDQSQPEATPSQSTAISMSSPPPATSPPDSGSPGHYINYREFKNTVERILDYEHPADALIELRALAELGQGGEGGGASGAGIDGDYKGTMRAILKWGMKVFANDPEQTGGHLWVTMRLLDGPRGYSQG